MASVIDRPARQVEVTIKAVIPPLPKSDDEMRAYVLDRINPSIGLLQLFLSAGVQPQIDCNVSLAVNLIPGGRT